MQPNKITILGSGSCNLVPERMAASALIQYDGKNFVYDFGRGTAIRLTQLGLKQDDVKTVILSHFHPDHVTDLLPFLQAASWSQIDRRSEDLTIYGPPGVKEFIAKLTSIFGGEETARGFSLKTVELKTGRNEIDGFSFDFVDLHHSHGIRFEVRNRDYSLMADSSLHEDLIRGLRDVELGIFDSGHLTNEEIAELAAKSHAKRLVCSHQYRELDGGMLAQQAAAKGFDGELVVADDLMEFNL